MKKYPWISGEHGEVTGHEIYHPVFERMRFHVGDIVKIINCAEAGKYGYIYDVYERRDKNDIIGYSVLADTDQDLGGFSSEEADEFFEFVGPSGVGYKFENVTKLAEDRRRGYFACIYCNQGFNKQAWVAELGDAKTWQWA